jgi:hypothetical protein
MSRALAWGDGKEGKITSLVKLALSDLSSQPSGVSWTYPTVRPYLPWVLTTRSNKSTATNTPEFCNSEKIGNAALRV